MNCFVAIVKNHLNFDSQEVFALFIHSTVPVYVDVAYCM